MKGISNSVLIDRYGVPTPEGSYILIKGPLAGKPNTTLAIIGKLNAIKNTKNQALVNNHTFVLSDSIIQRI